MTQFVEELARQHLWHWLDEEKGWTVDGEVQVEGGRVDLVAKAGNGEYIGIELKSSVRFETSSTVAEQIDRYMNSGAFDRFYFASPSVEPILDALNTEQLTLSLPVVREACYSLGAGISVGKYSKQEVVEAVHSRVPEPILEYNPGGDELIREYIDRKLEFDSDNDPITINEGIRQITSSTMSSEVGVIEVPLSLTNGVMEDPAADLYDVDNQVPEILIQSGQLKKSVEPSFQKEGEPWVRHYAWEEFGGIPEGLIPNTMPSDTVNRPIDILTFRGTTDPTEVLENPNQKDIIGVEAKGSDGLRSDRTLSQLSQFLEAKCLTKLFLVVPASGQKAATAILSKKPELDDKVGLFTVDKQGNVSIVKSAAKLNPEYDGYQEQGEIHKTGYGKVTIPDAKSVISPFSLTEWRETPVDSMGNPVTWDDDPTQYLPDIDDEIIDIAHEVSKKSLRECPEEETLRAYLLQGTSAAPSANNKPGPREPKKGYIRLTVSQFETEAGECGIDIHFGAGSYEGGYIRMVAKRIDAFCALVTSVHESGKQEFIGQGRAIDLDEFVFDATEWKLKGDDSLPEEQLTLIITSEEQGNRLRTRMKLCERENKGVSVVLTETQRLDLLRCLRIGKYGRTTQIPNEGSYKRIGPDGENTWEEGTSIEKSHYENFKIDL
jgi:hypothetical protein